MDIYAIYLHSRVAEATILGKQPPAVINTHNLHVAIIFDIFKRLEL